MLLYYLCKLLIARLIGVIGYAKKKNTQPTPPQNSRTYLFGGFFFIVLTYIGLKYCCTFEIGVINMYTVEYKSI